MLYSHFMNRKVKESKGVKGQHWQILKKGMEPPVLFCILIHSSASLHSKCPFSSDPRGKSTIHNAFREVNFWFCTEEKRLLLFIKESEIFFFISERFTPKV